MELNIKKTTVYWVESSESVFFVYSQHESYVCWNGTHTHTLGTLNLESSQRLFVLVYSAVEGKVHLSQMAQLRLPDQSCLGIRGYLCLTHSNKGSAPPAVFGQDPSTIISLWG